MFTTKKIKFASKTLVCIMILCFTLSMPFGYSENNSILMLPVTEYNALVPDSFSSAGVIDKRTVQPNGNKKNVILMIPDGQNTAEQTLTRWYQGTALATDEYVCGLVRTYSAESAITDSAAAATAYATGYKTNEGYEGMFPAKADMPGTVPVTGDNYEMPLATVLESAHLNGKSTGVVVTSPIAHATPAAFTSHASSRANFNKIARQQIFNNTDVMLGGGRYYLSEGRTDGRNLIEDAISMGYTYVNNSTDLANTPANKLLGVFASDDMDYDFDRTDDQPSLEQMTKKAIEVLNRNENGFFLLVEGSKVDYASHAHDPVGVISESISFDKAFKAAVDFAKQDGNTIVISCADHGNGAMSIGVGQPGYASTNINEYLNPLKRAIRTGAGTAYQFNSDRSNIDYAVSSYYGITDLSYEEKRTLQSTNEIMAALGSMMSKRVNIGWIGGGHTGEDVPLAIFAPDGKRLKGVVNNTDVSAFIQQELGLDLAKTNSDLFVPARALFESVGATVYFGKLTDSRAYLEVKYNDICMKLPIDTSIVVSDGYAYRVNGLTVLCGDRVYVSRDTLDLLNDFIRNSQQSAG